MLDEVNGRVERRKFPPAVGASWVPPVQPTACTLPFPTKPLSEENHTRG
jgi:hypothetical protein